MVHTGSIPATGTEEQFAARELVRSWAASSGAITAVRAVEQGDPEAWRSTYDGLAQLGIFGVAVPEDLGGAGGSVEDLCVMVDEAAAALVPGPVATTALASLVITDEKLLDALTSGQRTAGWRCAPTSSSTVKRQPARRSSSWVVWSTASSSCLPAMRGSTWTRPPRG